MSFTKFCPQETLFRFCTVKLFPALHCIVPRDDTMSPTATSIETQSPGVGQSGVADQYADGKAAKVTLNILKQITIYKDDILIQYCRVVCCRTGSCTSGSRTGGRPTTKPSSSTSCGSAGSPRSVLHCTAPKSIV